MHSLVDFGWDPTHRQGIDRLLDPSLVPARVTAVFRETAGMVASPDVSGDSTHRAREGDGPVRLVPATVRRRIATGIEAPTVGDWVAGRKAGDGFLIEHVLPRRSAFVRLAAGRRCQAQLVAANVDVVLVVTAVGEDLSPRRIERYVAAVRAGGSQPVVVLNKTDRPHDGALTRESLESCTPGVPLVSASAMTDDGLIELNALLRSGCTVAFVGSSGVGKSSLINRLLGDERLATLAVRHCDDTGRHATTRRELLVTPSGVVVIDTPGMREIGLWGAREGLDEAFPEVAELATRCRFRDCGHAREPGCAVQAATQQGLLPPERVRSYLHLVDEVADNEQRASSGTDRNAKERWKQVSKAVRGRRKLHGKLGLK